MLRTLLLPALALFVLFSLPARAQAGFIISLGNLTGPTGGAGRFEVLLSNTAPSGGPTFDVASFSFALMVPPVSGVQFTSAETLTLSATYLFAGTGGASVDPDFALSLDPFPNATFTGSDSEFMSPGIAVKPGDVFGLGWIAYSVSPGAPGGNVPITFIAAGTSLSDASGAAIPFTTNARNGVISLTAVPEPSSLALAAGGLAMTLLTRFYRQARGRPAC